MNTAENDDPTLPNGWILCSSKSNPGRKYYFNRKTGKSSWTKPQDGESSSDSRQRKKEKEKEQIKKAMDNLLRVKKDPSKSTVKRKSDGSSTDNSNKKKRQEPSLGKQNPQAYKKQPQNTNKAATGRAPTISAKKANVNTVLPVKRPSTSNTVSKTTTSASKRDNSSLNNSSSISPSKKAKTSQTHKSPIKIPQTASKEKKKNIALNRMNRLRADLSSESIEGELSPRKTPNTSQTDINATKADLKSPASVNESKCSTHSPNNDSTQSEPSPSQFFAANKIISSMKAQLPEEYSQKEKPKDTFADIEQGICNQVTEYPYMKHPGTPPQFSEASKLVSAIKLKLSYKTSKEPPPTFSSASERLQSLRQSLGTEAMDINMVSNETSQSTNEAMDVDLKETNLNVPVLNNVKDSISSKENLVLVVDTNIFIQELDFIKKVMNSHIKGFSEPPMLLVPWRVINELDKLKDSNNGNAAICKRARPAMDYLYKHLPENKRIKVQPLRDANSHIYPCESPDDEILNCCLQQAERGKSVILLSNDKNLCTKAVANGVQNKSLLELELEPTSEPHAPPDEAVRVQKHIYALLANILENEMRAKYDDIWERVVFTPPPWSLDDVLKCLLKHWMAVFRDVFPRIEHLVTELKNAVLSIEKKESKNITQSELSSFKELCLEVAKHCQIIPEYMELAKKTVARLQRDRASESDDETEKDGDNDKDGDNVVVEAFEGVWTVFSSYCAKLSSGLGIQHSIEDKLPSEDSMDVLTSKLHLFGNHIAALTQSIAGMLTENQSDQDLQENISRLEYSFKDSLGAIGVHGAPITTNKLRTFCTNCRIMLQEAHSKFSQLVDLLQICKSNISVGS